MSRRLLIVLVVIVLIIVLVAVVRCTRTVEAGDSTAVPVSPAGGAVAAKLPEDFNGIWLGKTYVCEGQVIEERVEIVQEGDMLTATKIDGDQCVLAGTVTFEGTLSADGQADLTCITGMPDSPGSSSFRSGIAARDDGGFDACNVTYVRPEAEAAG
jgi:hypothetical protein